MAKMDLRELKAILDSERAAALAAMVSSKLSNERADALDYYMGDMSKDMPAADGRSHAVSSDVADTIDGMMPTLMDIFCSGDEVVRFEPQGPEDVQGSEQETDYVNHVFMQQNPGFLVLYSMIKDALLSKVGVVKVRWETKTVDERETYQGLGPDELAMIKADEDVEIVEEEEVKDEADPNGREPGEPPVTYNVVCKRSKEHAQVKIEPVPPEEFGISRNARSLRDCDYAFHKVLTTPGKLIAQGFDEDQANRLPGYTAMTNTEEINRDTVNEYQFQGDGLNKSGRRIEVTEHYIRMDYEGDGNPRLYMVTTGGVGAEILEKDDGKPAIEPIDMIPLAAMTPVIMTHRFFGRSIADLVMDIQRIKTALLRGTLDNVYLANNPRVEVAETHAGPQTLDDLLVSRPGGVVRTRQPGGINWQVVPNVSSMTFPAIEYMDSIREWRTGVTRQGQGIDANALQNQSATAVNQVFTASQARIKLIARIFAETGIRDLFQLVHATIRKHGEEAQVVRLRNQWVQVDPRNWKTRVDMSINVGLGNGSKAERVVHLMTLIGLQKEAIGAGMTNLVSAQELYNSGKELTKLLDLKNTESFFKNPADPNNPAPQPKPDPKLIELQAKNQIEQTQAQADIATQNMKTQAEIQLAREKAALDAQLMERAHQLKEREHNMQMAMMMAKASQQPRQTVKDADGNEQVVEGGGNEHLAPMMMMFMDHMRKASAPKTIRKNHDGSWTAMPHEGV